MVLAADSDIAMISASAMADGKVFAIKALLRKLSDAVLESFVGSAGNDFGQWCVEDVAQPHRLSEEAVAGFHISIGVDVQEARTLPGVDARPQFAAEHSLERFAQLADVDVRVVIFQPQFADPFHEIGELGILDREIAELTLLIGLESRIEGKALDSFREEETVDLFGKLHTVSGDDCHHRQGNPFLLAQFHSSEHRMEGTPPTDRLSMMVVDPLGSIETDADPEAVPPEELGEGLVDQGAVRLDAVGNDGATTIVFPLKLNRLVEEAEPR